MKKKTIIILLLSAFTIALTLFSYSFYVIYRGVKATCLKAQNEYKENCLYSLITYIEADKHTIKERNSAIWALGQLADPKALPFLYKLNESLPEQDKCSYSVYLCKYEVKKAIKWCENGNVTNWMYRNRNSWH